MCKSKNNKNNKTIRNIWVQKGNPNGEVRARVYHNLVWSFISEFGVQCLEFRVWSSGIVTNFTEVKRDRGFLDIGFSSCTVPTFCHSLVISDGGSGIRKRGSELREE